MSESTYPSVKDLTLEEKASLTSGGDAWHLQGVESKGIPGYMITDGPHGLRKSLASSAGETDLDASVPATCFPPAAGLSSSWNPELIRKVGEAMGEECIQEKVAVILGPGVNIKRNPLGGRCFEYWSEDPYLAGHEAIGIVEGVQSKGVGTSLKHFAANNQETDRLRISANIGPRALREIYLPAFEHIVKTAQPWTVMCSYNRINGVYSAQNRWLLTDVLRGEWGFEGIVMSDWGADHDRVASLNAGLNLEMPPSYTDDEIVHAARDGRIAPAQLDAMAQGMIDLVNRTRAAMSVDDYRFDVDAHDEVAHQAAVESIVMLKNDGAILPLDADAASGQKIAVIGEFARTPRYQGGGSSHITPTRMTSFLDVLDERGIAAEFAPGFTLDLEPADPALETQAVDAAKRADTVLMFLGLPEAAESEGFDRETLDIPAKQIALLDAVAAANDQVVVVLSNGSAVSVAPWAGRAKGILESWLLGQAGGPALADVIFGRTSPSGKLAQTIPMDINDDPSMVNWPGEEGHVDYGEGVFVGYRYYDTYGKAVGYPFGYGLSYATFEISKAAVARTGANTAVVTATVTNTSGVDGAETVQVYVAPGKADVARPRHELKGFVKVFLKAGESADVAIDLDERAFAYWSERYDDWHIESGEYAVEIGTSSRDIAATVTVALEGDGKTQPLTAWSTYGEWSSDPIGAKVMAAVAAAGEAGELPKLPDNAMMNMFLMAMPINSLPTLMSEGGKSITRFMLDEYARLTK
ncbi:MAG: exo-alpha-(1-_6)-L-arabinopyranosidase [Bifidobacterium scardovii]|uniref:exo-alpha-(1->6)-L-arabinopyranosidase n=1 Tax=Bifidobacterium scardovii TaxID=158787 RepID=UPI0006662B63|nr:exo-alpha-(1->6)-L-arabinopyranosidase [Bifidobacterium scardovii]MBS6947901.1 glycoside hydrolase family 3 C-terminal domain-containing protein [Bifidobacterium scardovii]MDU3736180.1 exo-alpha-(1->6)-L-arabinopyranosidase [Bifidobacterium scardovii]MDU5297217.1 exo-alpha-(1->6)-L-arabinopyranosidase [Bifidobacterium scardovii]MDU5611617.1 exo-alpha-(1->6)-L-arabinopyranosidase [Bifidobacterium scardovii]MDU5887958.1 exo-alpha-(1->6)-L-arabinopyranosidase [Bifidobacterium scardovii]